jgi:hypothetical protein
MWKQAQDWIVRGLEKEQVDTARDEAPAEPVAGKGRK